jgi:uncharacterized RDD family membrane protein YckC
MDNFNYAGFGIRLLAHVIDTILLVVVNALLGIGLGIGLSLACLSVGMDSSIMKTLSSLIGGVLGIVISWLYFALMESSVEQATLGKKLLKIKVTDVEGNRLTFARATGRHFSKWISNCTILIGYVMAAFTERHQALHDIIAQTLVLKNPDQA